jgi:hypothetical protein
MRIVLLGSPGTQAKADSRTIRHSASVDRRNVGRRCAGKTSFKRFNLALHPGYAGRASERFPSIAYLTPRRRRHCSIVP